MCPCLFGGPPFNSFGGDPLGEEEMRWLQRGYVRELHTLVDSGRWIDLLKPSPVLYRYERKDFTVVIQPAFTDVRMI